MVVRRTDTSIPTSDQARAELVSLASEKLGRPLTETEEEIRLLEDSEVLTSGYFASLYRGYAPTELLDWFSRMARIRMKFAEIARRRSAITNEQLAQARAEVVQIATEKLGRALTRGEEKVIRGLDKTLIAEGTIANLFRGYSQQDLADSFAEVGACPGPVALLNSLGTGRFSLKASRKKVLEFVKGREALEGFDFEAALEDFSAWFVDLLRSEPLGNNTRALRFGLFESENGFQLYVSGASAYNKEDSDWASTADWSPERCYAPFDVVSKMLSELHTAGDESWVIAQAVATVIVRAFFENHHADFRKLTGLKRVYIACGFDDGDLYRLRTPVSPRA